MRTRIVNEMQGAKYVPAFKCEGTRTKRFSVMNNNVRTFRDVVREWMAC